MDDYSLRLLGTDPPMADTAALPKGLLELLLEHPHIRYDAVAHARARMEAHAIPPPPDEMARQLMALLVAERAVV
jgi:hypothetical protein